MASASDQTQIISKPAKITYFVLIFVLVWFLIITLFYFAFGINLLTALTSLPFALLATILIYRDDKYTSYKVQRTTYNVHGGYFWLFALMAIITDGFLITQMVAARTGDAIVSPWDVLGWPHWILFFISCLFLILSWQYRARLRIVALLLHFTVMFWVAAIIYGVGFGFDPFIHQAGESAIVMHGKIAPLTILYSGQYAIVSVLAILTHLPAHLVDIWLVPALTILFTMAILLINKDDGWHKFLALMLIPLPFLTFTIPFNFAVLFLTVTILLINKWENRSVKIIIALMALFSLFLHPLIGIPHIAIAIAILVKRDWMDRSLIVAIPLLIVGAFAFYNLMHGGQIHLANGMMFRQNLKMLFANPYVNANYPLLSFLYFIKYIWPWMFMVLGYWMIKKDKTRKNDILIYSAGGMFVAAVLINNLFYFQDIVAREQFEFALRLIKVLPIFFIPGVTLFLKRILDHKNIASLKMIVIAVLMAVIVTGSWFFNYEQNNAVAAFTAPAVSQDEIDAVIKIHELAEGEKYMVLSDQMTAAAALRIYDFSLKVRLHGSEANSYAIPTGGYLYEQYQFLFKRPDLLRDTVDQILESSDAELLFIVIKESWDPHHILINELQKISKDLLVDKDVTIFKIRRNPDFML